MSEVAPSSPAPAAPSSSPSPSATRPASKAIAIPRSAGIRSARAAAAASHSGGHQEKTGPVTATAPAVEPEKVAATPVGSEKPTPEGHVATNPGAVEPEKPAPQLHKVKVNGVEREVALEDLIRGYSKGETADERFRQSSELDKKAQVAAGRIKEFVQTLKDPSKFAQAINSEAKALGLDSRALGEALLGPIIEQQMREAEIAAMTPEQRELYEAKERLKAYEKQDLDAKQAQEVEMKKAAEVKKQGEIKTWREKFEPQLIQALEKAGLPKSRELGLELVQVYKAAMLRGEDTTPEMLAQEMASRKRAEWNTVVKATGDLNYVSPEVRELIRKQAVDEHLKKHPMAASEPVTAKTKKPDATNVRTTTFASLQRKLLSRRTLG